MNTIEQLDELPKKAIHTPELKKGFLHQKRQKTHWGNSA